MSEIFVDSTFSTNKHGYCVLTEYDFCFSASFLPSAGYPWYSGGGSGIDPNDSVEDDARSLRYAEGLESLQLLPTEHPEAAEENDEEAMEPLRVFGWAIQQCE
ncbi:hypothetical protein V1524DRAFT_409285 [Lipomyces starkeyi]